MSILARPRERRERSCSTSTSSSAASEDSPVLPQSLSLLPNTNTMDRRQGLVFPQSTPALVNQLDGANSSTEAGREAPTSTHPARYHSHGAIASHFLSQSHEAYGGQTWVDFLRESGAEQHQAASPFNSRQSGEIYAPAARSSRNTLPTRLQWRGDAPPSASRGSDRKRRLTAADSPLRRPSSIRMVSGDAATSGASSSDPIVLASSTPPARLPRHPLPSPSSHSRSQSHSIFPTTRRENEFALPLWQPDTAAHHCPVCSNQFSFFLRKHHCRRCGRVVCAACSPNRITIPHEYIVRSPTDSQISKTTMASNPVLGGGAMGPVPLAFLVPTPRAPGTFVPGSAPGMEFGRIIGSTDSLHGRRPSQSINHDPQPVEQFQQGLFNLRNGLPDASRSLPRIAPPAPGTTHYQAIDDDCPVCDKPLPRSGPSIRELHIRNCINHHMSRASGGHQGSVTYTATVKDCLDESDGPVECVICFEEFQAGDRMTRLPCWCKFHDQCIDDWFGQRTAHGRCPTHKWQK